MEHAEPLAALSPAMRRARSVVLVVAALLLSPAHGGGLPSQAARTAAAPVARDTAARHELVVLVHGMGRSSFSMRPLAKALEDDGYEVLSFGYSSYCCGIPELGSRLRAAVDARITGDIGAVHFVAHSLGGILVRWLLTRDTLPPHVGRVVMLAPPNQGAASADRYAGLAGWLLRPMDGLRTDSSSTVRQLPPVRGVEIGIIAARDDRTVRVMETHLDEESAHIMVGGGHTFIMRRPDVIERTREFLRSGTFANTGSPVPEP